MGYRRLPTTDRARYLALERMSTMIGKGDMGVLLRKEKELVGLINEFGSLLDKRASLAEQKKNLNQTKNSLLNSLRLYVSHFFQVLNFSIDRGEMEKTVRKLYGSQVNMGNIPELSNVEQLDFWVGRIIKGEKKRVSIDKLPISHPSVKKIEQQQKELKTKQRELAKIEAEIQKNKLFILSSRTKVDPFIKQAWNEIEAKYSNETIAARQQKAARYGVVYVG